VYILSEQTFRRNISPLACSLQPPAHAGSSLANFSTLKMEAICSSETSVHTISSRRHIPEDGVIHSHRRENLKSYYIKLDQNEIKCGLGTRLHCLGTGYCKHCVYHMFHGYIIIDNITFPTVT
jgi:hypothetical protein